MFRDQAILVVEDEPLIAMAITSAIEDFDGNVIGPVSTVAEAIALLQAHQITAAVLDANLADGNVTPLALNLASQGVPFIIFTGRGLPSELAAVLPNLPVMMKPATPTALLSRLCDLMTVV